MALVAPIRERRLAMAGDPAMLDEVVRAGTARARETAAGVLADVRRVFALE